MSAREKVDVVQDPLWYRPSFGPTRPRVSGMCHSPRKQGAGLVDALWPPPVRVPDREGCLRVVRPKADLGMKDGWHFDVVLHNLSDAEVTTRSPPWCSRSSTAASSRSIPRLAGRGAVSRTAAQHRESGEGATVTVPAGGEAMVMLDIVPGLEFAQYVADNAPLGPSSMASCATAHCIQSA